MMRSDSEERLCKTYTADCIGAITRALHQSTELPLFSDLLHRTRVTEETAEEVIDNILGQLLSTPEKGEPDGSV